MKHYHTLFIAFFIALQLGAQSFADIVKQTVVLDSKGNIVEVNNYHSQPLNLFCIYKYSYNELGYLTKLQMTSGQTWKENAFYPLDTAYRDWAYVYKYDSKGRKIEEKYYDQFYFEMKCEYAYKGDTAITATKYFMYNATPELKVVYKLHKIPATAKGRPASETPQLYEKAYYDSTNKLIRKIKYTYTSEVNYQVSLVPWYGWYAEARLKKMEAFDEKGKLLQERRVVLLPDTEMPEEVDSVIVHKSLGEDDSYDIKYEDVYYRRGSSGQEYPFTFTDPDSEIPDKASALDYINCRFNLQNVLVETGAWFDYEVHDLEDFDFMQRITKDKLIKGYIVTEK